MKSIAEHKINGTYRADRHGKTKLVGNKLKRTPSSPGELSKEGERHFKKICSDLIRMGILFESDLQAVGRLAHLYCTQNHLQKLMNDLTPGSKNYLQYLRDYDRISKLILPLESALGLNVTSRRRIDVQEEDTPLSSLFK